MFCLIDVCVYVPPLRGSVVAYTFQYRGVNLCLCNQGFTPLSVIYHPYGGCVGLSYYGSRCNCFANIGYENMVAQMLTATGNKLFYHTWPMENSNHNYEIDFLLSRGSKIWPIEVKSSGYKTHASLDAFCQKFSERISKRYLIYTKDLKKDEATTLLPVFMTIFL